MITKHTQNSPAETKQEFIKNLEIIKTTVLQKKQDGLIILIMTIVWWSVLMIQLLMMNVTM
jgi:hypothetical protein